MSDEKTLIQHFLDGGWLITLLGAGGMTARILNSDVKHSLWDFVKKVIVATIASSICWFVLEQSSFGSFTKAITYGIVGVISPELIDGIILLARKAFSKPVNFAVQVIKKLMKSTIFSSIFKN